MGPGKHEPGDWFSFNDKDSWYKGTSSLGDEFLDTGTT